MTLRRPIFGPNWGWWAFRSDAGHLHLVYFDADLAAEEEHRGYSYALRVFVRAHDSDGDGIPRPREEYTGLRERLVAALEAESVPCLLVGEAWHEGYFEMLFQVADEGDEDEGDEDEGDEDEDDEDDEDEDDEDEDDEDEDDDAFTEVFFKWKDALPDYEVVPEPAGEGWDFFDRHISPDLLGLEQINDRPLINLLRSGITDVTCEHLVEFDLTGPEGEVAAMEAELCARDFVKVEREEGFLVVGRRMLLDPIEIARVTARLRLYARPRGCSLDGWSTTPRR